MGLYLTNSADNRVELPEVGEFLQVEATTVEPGIGKVNKVEHLGAGKLPEPARATWGQLLNGSLDSQWVELSGWVQDVTNRANGWSRLSLHMSSGVLRVDLRRAGVKPGPVDQYNNAVIRLRGCMFADWHPDTLRLKVGQIRMYDVDVVVEQPAVQDFETIPKETVTALMRFDPAFDPARRVRVSGQIVFVRGADYFMMDGKDGIRFLAKEPLGFQAGDLVEAAGFPELSGAAPVLRGATARKTGQAPLPRPREIASGELNNIANDSALVRVEGLLTRIKHTPDNQVLEMQAGPWRFLAKISAPDAAVDRIEPGSRLGLTGVYCAQGGYAALGTDVVPLDLLLNSVTDIAVLASPPWWTLQRLLVVVGALAAVLVLAVLWITQLSRKVEVRTVQLAEQIKQREHVEHLRAMEQERARIAQDLHDELGSDITEIGMLAARARSISGSEEERGRHLAQMGDKAREMVNALEEIVWAMNPTHNSLASLVSYFSFYAERFLGLANINWELEELPGAANCAVDSRRRHELFLAFREALTNIVRHSGATQVKLAIGAENGELRLVVTDNGCGLAPVNGNGHAHGKDGIANMKARIEGLGGRFDIVSQNGHGTTVNLTLPAT
jgi:signal transduction histidine kinase